MARNERIAGRHHSTPRFAALLIACILTLFFGCATLETSITSPYNLKVDKPLIMTALEQPPLEIAYTLSEGRRDIDGETHPGRVDFVITNVSERNVYAWNIRLPFSCSACYEYNRPRPPKDRRDVRLKPGETYKWWYSVSWGLSSKDARDIAVCSVMFLDLDSEDYSYETWKPTKRPKGC